MPAGPFSEQLWVEAVPIWSAIRVHPFLTEARAVPAASACTGRHITPYRTYPAAPAT